MKNPSQERYIQLGILVFVNFLETVFYWIKDTSMEKASSNKTPLLMKIMNMDVWVVVALLNEPFIIGSYTGIQFSKNC